MKEKKVENIILRELGSRDLIPDFLMKFNRYQVTNRVWFKQEDKYKIKDDHFIEQWNNEKKTLVIDDLHNCIKSGGIVIGAFRGSDLIGFASIAGEIFGRNREYLELSYIHVSNEYRNMGIGKKLFEQCCIKAKEKGCKKLYIAAQPSVESQHFYKSIGCTYAVEINRRILDKEPLDIQLEYSL